MNQKVSFYEDDQHFLFNHNTCCFFFCHMHCDPQKRLGSKRIVHRFLKTILWFLQLFSCFWFSFGNYCSGRVFFVVETIVLSWPPVVFSFQLHAYSELYIFCKWGIWKGTFWISGPLIQNCKELRTIFNF